MQTPLLKDGIGQHSDAATNAVLAAAYRLLHATGHHALRAVVCEMESETTLVLRGTVPTFYQKQLAQAALLNQPGILSISNRIHVLGGG